jgi:coatomer subunit beta'
LRSSLSSFLLKRTDECVRLLAAAGRVPEAAFLARTYAPSLVSEEEAVGLWKQDLAANVNNKAAEALADPAQYLNLFRDFDWALKAEELVRKDPGKATRGRNSRIGFCS